VALELGLWRVDGSMPVRVTPSGVPFESQLEGMIEADPTMLGSPLLLIGRQVPTEFGKFIDVLALDDEGALHVLELKRDRTPREVVAQVLDYGSWVQGVSHEQVLDIFSAYRPGVALEQAWSDRFGGSPPEELNATHQLTVVANEVDPATERIVTYLAGFAVPVNVVFFRYFVDGDRAYLAQTWLLPEGQGNARGAQALATRTRGPWNGTDWYVSFGEENGSRNWEDASTYGFISAGGGEWFSRTLRKLPAGGRVFVCIPKTGYVGVGTVAGPAQRFDDATVTVDGLTRRLAELPLTGTYRHAAANAGEDMAEYIVPVAWTATRPRADAVWAKGLFANQNSACKLRSRFTLDHLMDRFGLDD
jgi:hypothetical protein